MDFRHLRYFIVVAEELNFSRAAERLHISQPPLSQQVLQLEEEIGVKLFHRTKRRVELTEAGSAFLSEARGVLAQLEHAARTAVLASAGEVGQLTIATITSTDSGFYALLVEILREFGRLYPEVHLALRTMPASQQIQALRDDRIHVGFLVTPAVDPALEVFEVRREPLMVALPERNHLSSKQRIAWRDLATEPFIIPTRSLTPGFYDSIVAHFMNLKLSINIVNESDGLYAGLALVAAGSGACLLPSSLSKAPRKGVVWRRTQAPVLYQNMGVAYRRNDQTATLKLFLDIVKKVAGQYRHVGDSPKDSIALE